MNEHNVKKVNNMTIGEYKKNIIIISMVLKQIIVKVFLLYLV